MTKTLVIYVLSDSIGETGERVLRAAGSQFDGYDIIFRRFPYVTGKGVLKQILDEAAIEADIVAYTLVVPGLPEILEEYSKDKRYNTIDILGPVIQTIYSATGWHPRNEPGLLHALDEEYYRQVEAIEFAVKYDDGKDPRGLLSADIILIGVSRTSKTPLSMYLAHRGYRVANVPLMPEVMAPEELFAVDKRKIVGLMIKPQVLTEIRCERLKALGLGKGASYADDTRIRSELEYAKKIMQDIGCPIIDVTHKAVEETASIIMELYKA